MHLLTPTGALKARWAVLMVLLSAVLVTGSGIFYTYHVQRQADRRWCALLRIQAADNPPPSTDRGRASQRESKRLLLQLGCEDR